VVGGAADGGSPEANANVDERPDDEKSKDAQEPLDLAHALPGAVLTVFVGATAFLGLKTTEVDDILRNQAVIPSLVALLLLASVIVSILSMTDRYGKITVRAAVAAISAILGLGSLLIWITPVPFTTSGDQRFVSLVAGLALLAAALLLALLALRTWLKKSHTAQSGQTKSREPPESSKIAALLKEEVGRPNILLVLAVMLAANAVYGAMRLEAISQVSAPYAQVGAKIQVSGSLGTLTLEIAGSKLRNGDRIGATVFGLPWRGVPLTTMCQSSQAQAIARQQPAYPCLDDPCLRYFHCIQLDGMNVEANADGTADETFSVPFSASSYQHLRIIAEVCQRMGLGQTCTYTNPKSKQFTGQETRVDLSIPRPPPPS
jgi:NADH:ubiquinone oxidoreductase subunit 6 (subunit J)